MDPTTQRLFLFADEWLLILLAVYLVHRITAGMHYPEETKWWKVFAAVVLPLGALMVYGLGYPSFFGWWQP